MSHQNQGTQLVYAKPSKEVKGRISGRLELQNLQTLLLWSLPSQEQKQKRGSALLGVPRKKSLLVVTVSLSHWKVPTLRLGIFLHGTRKTCSKFVRMCCSMLVVFVGQNSQGDLETGRPEGERSWSQRYPTSFSADFQIPPNPNAA